jgi:tol-pal system protein YbgF
MLLAAACAAPKRVDQSLSGLEKTTAQLRSENQDLRRRLEDLGSVVMVLQDRLETMKVHMERQSEGMPQQASKPGKADVKAHPVKSLKVRKEEMIEGPVEEEPFLTRNDPRDAKKPTIQLSNRDLERMEKKGSAPEAAPAPSAAAEQAARNEDNPEATRAYNGAFAKFEDQKYPEAVAAFESFVGRFREHSYADNAVYWIGESFFRLKNFVRAVQEFERVWKEFPAGNKVPEAMLRAGDCYVRLASPEKALSTFKKVISMYPQSVAAEKARAWISDYSAAAGRGRM